MRVTINDIARVTGFSKTSVSFAFNDPHRISTATREKIMRVAQELGYVPDPVARNLSTRKVGTIGFVLPQAISKALQNSHLSQIIQGVGQICHSEEYSLTLVPPQRGFIGDGVRAAAVDGFITHGLHPDMNVVRLIRMRHVPFVTIDANPAEDVPAVNINDEEAAYTGLSYVLKAGHRKIVIAALDCSVEADEGTYPGVNEWRWLGFARALREAGLDPEKVRQYIAHPSPSGGVNLVREYFDSPRSTWPTALVCSSDVVAIGAMMELRRRGISVPETVSITGFDDIPEAAMITPGLTTIAQPGKDKGEQAARMLFRLIRDKEEHPGTQGHLTLDSHLVIRESVRVIA